MAILRTLLPAKRRAALLAAPLLIAAPLLLTGCAADNSDASGSSGSSGSTGTSHSDSSSDHGVTLTDGWVKAADADGMSGVFGTLENHGDHDLVITGVTSDAAGMVELHEVTADGVMQPIAGDVTVPANGSLTLAPGADHIMLMDLTRDLLAGDEATFTVSFDDGSSAELAVLVKDYAGANEDYGDVAHDGAHDGATHGAPTHEAPAAGHDSGH